MEEERRYRRWRIFRRCCHCPVLSLFVLLCCCREKRKKRRPPLQGGSNFCWDSVNAEGLSSGILLVWHEDLFCDMVVQKAKRWTCVKGKLKSNGFECIMGVVYGAHDREEKRQVWAELLDLRERWPQPWLLMGDFNEILKLDERSSGWGNAGCMEEFGEWVQNMDLMELPLTGRRFTWRRGSSSSQIDRAFFHEQWNMKFPNLILEPISCSRSDHILIVVREKKLDWGLRPFRSLDAWLTHPGFKRLVEKEWKTLPGENALAKLNGLKVPIRQWNCEIFGNIDSNIKKLELDMEGVDKISYLNPGCEVAIARKSDLMGQLDAWYHRKGLYWKQMAREKYISDVDKNSKYFHVLANLKRKRKQVSQIKVGARIIKEPKRVKVEIRKFFKNLYRQKEVLDLFFPEGIVQQISEEDALALERRPSCEEIKKAV